MVGIELVADQETRVPFPAERRVAWNLCMRLRRHGILLRPLGDVLVLMPPLSIITEELRLLTGAIAEELRGISA
jgi:adenosylmethionine-8-amino-7-oxononanoate aminotransferase